MNRVFETLFKFVNKYFILIAIVQVIIFNIYFFTITRHEEYFTENVCNETLSGTKATGYRGCQNKTISGKICMNWNSQTPQKHSNTPEKKKDFGVGDHNYCRNPDGRNTIWCYTTDSNKRWTYCEPIKPTSNLKKTTTESKTESKTESRTENRNVESKPWNYVKMYIYRTDPREDLYNIYSKLIENKTNAEKKSILRKWKRKIKKYLQELAITVATAAKRLRHSTGQAKDNLDDRIELLKSRIQQLKNAKIKIRAAISKISSE